MTRVVCVLLCVSVGAILGQEHSGLFHPNPVSPDLRSVLNYNTARTGGSQLITSQGGNNDFHGVPERQSITAVTTATAIVANTGRQNSRNNGYTQGSYIRHDAGSLSSGGQITGTYGTQNSANNDRQNFETSRQQGNYAGSYNIHNTGSYAGQNVGSYNVENTGSNAGQNAGQSTGAYGGPNVGGYSGQNAGSTIGQSTGAYSRQTFGSYNGQYASRNSGQNVEGYSGHNSNSNAGQSAGAYGRQTFGNYYGLNAGSSGGQSAGRNAGQNAAAYGGQNPTTYVSQNSAPHAGLNTVAYTGVNSGIYGGQINGGHSNDYNEPANYQFQYQISDPVSQLGLGHEEQRLGDNTQGRYHTLMPDGRTQNVEYTSDQDGYRPVVTYHGNNNASPSNGYTSGAAGSRYGYHSGSNSYLNSASHQPVLAY